MCEFSRKGPQYVEVEQSTASTTQTLESSFYPKERTQKFPLRRTKQIFVYLVDGVVPFNKRRHLGPINSKYDFLENKLAEGRSSFSGEQGEGERCPLSIGW